MTATAAEATFAGDRLELGAPTIARRPPRIGVLYPSGAGNLGDEAILQATFAALRARWPDVELKAFTLHPAKTAANHGVEAEALTGVNRKLFGAPRPDGPFVVRAAWGVARRSRAIPVVGKAARWFASTLSTLVFEGDALRRATSWLRTADLLLASGGGQLDAVWGGTWGQPYALARWAWLAGRARVPFAFLSVGYGGTPTRLSRKLIRFAITRSTYCSVRDTGSRALAEQLGVDVDLPVVPDLAFALEARPRLRPRRPGYDVALSPMVYLRPGLWPKENRAEYERFVELWADLATERVKCGDRVHLFVSDPADMEAVHDVCKLLDDDVRSACEIVDAATPNDLLEFFRRIDVVISSRLHGVLLAIVAERPVLALSHERKVRTLMRDAGVAEFCTELPGSTAVDVLDRLDGLLNELESCGRTLAGYAGVARAAVTRQENLLPGLLRRR